jgi:glycosyltransferase involved in cell wall biosynthesis
MPKLPNLSLFFPAYNEEANIERMVREAQKILPEVALDWEIIPVDDGSRDKTGEIADRLAKEDPHVKPVHHLKNQGYGGAVVSGFKAAKMDYVFFTDGDLQFDLREITLLIDKIDEGDLILGFRKNRRDPWNRKLNAFCWGTLVKLLFGFRAKDVDCAFKLVKRKVLDKVELTSTSAMVSTELLARSHKAGFRFAEAGVTHLPRQAGTQTGAKFSVILKAFKELFKLYGKIK